MIDAHCHIDLFPNPEEIAKQCIDRQVTVVSVTTTPSAYKGTLALAKANPLIFTALGLHPQIAEQRHSELELFDDLAESVQWIGEVGLDGSPECLPTWRKQEAAFSHILQTCERLGGKIMSIHSRCAASSVIEKLSLHKDCGTAILHWFSGTKKEMESAIALGCWFSVGVPMIRTRKGRQLIESIPRSRILTESDGPFVQIDGLPSPPWIVDLASQELAALWRCDTVEVNQQLRLNFDSLRKTIG